MQQLKIKDIFNINNLAIFNNFNTLYPNLLDKFNYDIESMDYEFLGNYGEKKISPLIKTFLDDNNKLSQINFNRLLKIINNHFYNKWAKLIEIDNQTYNAMNDYNYHTGRLHDSKENYKNINNTENTANTQQNIYGFNSDSSVPQNDSIGSGLSTQTNERNVTDNTKHFNEVIDEQGRKGRTPQEMIMNERKVANFDTLKTLFDDVSSIIAISIY